MVEHRDKVYNLTLRMLGNRAEDVTQDAFSKALLALRGSENEIELRPWLYRIVRNTALNERRSHRDHDEIDETIDGVEQPPQAFERRNERPGFD